MASIKTNSDIEGRNGIYCRNGVQNTKLLIKITQEKTGNEDEFKMKVQVPTREGTKHRSQRW